MILFAIHYALDMSSKSYTLLLSAEDYLFVEFESLKGNIQKFVIQYYFIFKGEWKVVLRIDNRHGTIHKHVFHLHSQEVKILLNGTNSEMLNEYKNYITVNFIKIRDNYLNT